jgi:hypothetical protein
MQQQRKTNAAHARGGGSSVVGTKAKPSTGLATGSKAVMSGRLGALLFGRPARQHQRERDGRRARGGHPPQRNLGDGRPLLAALWVQLRLHLRAAAGRGGKEVTV